MKLTRNLYGVDLGRFYFRVGSNASMVDLLAVMEEGRAIPQYEQVSVSMLHTDLIRIWS